MADRLYMSGNPPRVVSSVAGREASPTLEEQYKTFDSDWLLAGGVKFKLTAPLNSTSINFPYPLSYIPAVYLFQVVDRVIAGGIGFWDGVPSSFGWPSPPSDSLSFSGIHASVDNQRIFDLPTDPGWSDPRWANSFWLAHVMEG